MGSNEFSEDEGEPDFIRSRVANVARFLKFPANVIISLITPHLSRELAKLKVFKDEMVGAAKGVGWSIFAPPLEDDYLPGGSPHG